MKKVVVYGPKEAYETAKCCDSCMLKKHSSLGCRAGVTRCLRSDVDGKQNTVVGGVIECGFKLIQGSIW